eukprot:m.126568 g.126568  ORF g.126568 m.126568 type:complete len:333 (+) comp15774_c0_seq14:3098-4096(+)
MASRRRQKAGKGLGSALMKNQPHRHPTNRKTASSAVKTASVVVVSASDGLVQDWLEQGRLKLMRNCGEPTAAQLAKAQQKIKDLSTNADVDGISFSGRALHHVYYNTKFKRRGWLTYSVFKLANESPTRAWQQTLRSMLASLAFQPSQSEGLRVCSLGGGPGTDAASLSWINQHFWHYPPSQPLDISLLDAEGSWKRHLTVLQSMLVPHNLSFVKGDVTVSMDAVNNHSVRTSLSGCGLYLFSYVCHETSRAAQSGQHMFYKDLASQLQPHAVLLFLDVMAHSQACLQAIAEVIMAACPYHVDMLTGTDDSRRQLKAEMVVLKVSSTPIVVL